MQGTEGMQACRAACSAQQLQGCCQTAFYSASRARIRLLTSHNPPAPVIRLKELQHLLEELAKGRELLWLICAIASAPLVTAAVVVHAVPLLRGLEAALRELRELVAAPAHVAHEVPVEARLRARMRVCGMLRARCCVTWQREDETAGAIDAAANGMVWHCGASLATPTACACA